MPIFGMKDRETQNRKKIDEALAKAVGKGKKAKGKTSKPRSK